MIFSYAYNLDYKPTVLDYIVPVTISLISLFFIVILILGLIKGFKSNNLANLLIIAITIFEIFFIFVLMNATFEMNVYLSMIFYVICLIVMIIKGVPKIKENKFINILKCFSILLATVFSFYLTIDYFEIILNMFK